MSKLLKRKVFYVQVHLASPLSVSSGEQEWTDSDVLRDAKGNPFVAGSSIASAMRAYLEKEKNQKCFMGYADCNAADGGRMSSLFVSDLNFMNDPVANIRDGVALDDNKTAVTESKYDMEILEAGSKAYFYAELAVREEDREEEMEQQLAYALQGIDQGEIRFGGKKTRGFGKLKIEKLSSITYGKENYLDYAKAYDAETWKNCQDKKAEVFEKAQWKPKMVHIEVPLRMKGGISIRQYAARKDEPDFVQLKDHGKAVIPGSSMTGAIRHRARSILEELKRVGVDLPKNLGRTLDAAFGYVEGTEACISNIIVGETEIEGAKDLTVVRTGVSRFESAVKKRSLYKEKTAVDGKLKLEIYIRKGKYPEDEKWILGLVLLALKDLQNGFLAVGGQTAIGRGIFEADGEIKIDGETGKEEEYIADMLKNMEISKGGRVWNC